MNVDIHFPIANEDMWATLAGYTSHRPVNAVRAVVAAPPGMVSTVDLPQVIGEAGGRSAA
jgi:4-hydroxy-tetrahydrodipicolinate reductase